MEGRKGEKWRKLRVYDTSERREIDAELANRTIDFMGRSTKAGKPFLRLCADHPSSHGDGAGQEVCRLNRTRRLGRRARREMDGDAGRILDAVSELEYPMTPS